MTTQIITTESLELTRTRAPALPFAPTDYDREYHNQYNSILRLYFNQIDNLIGQLMASTSSLPITFPENAVDAFGRLVVSTPYTLFDSQNRYAPDDQFDTAVTGGGSITFLPNEATVRMDVGTASGDEVVRQTFRSFPYQPGKGLTLLATFVMNGPKAGLRQRVGYFNTGNGAFLQRDGTTVSFVLRSSSIPTPGTPSDINSVNQADWNVDPMDGTGPSGRVLDLTKDQILYMDFEWLGTGDVRCGFYVDGEPNICHIFHNDNVNTAVYMTTAILPVRYEVTNTAVTASASFFKQVCSSVLSMGGYEQTSSEHVARRTTKLTGFGTTFVPLVSIRLASGREGAVVLVSRGQVMPTVTQYYEVVLFKNATLTGASWTAVPSDSNVQYDQTATAVTGGTIMTHEYVSSTSQSRTAAEVSAGYNWDLQLGASIAGVSDVLTLAIRTLDATPTGDSWGTLNIYDLTQ